MFAMLGSSIELIRNRGESMLGLVLEEIGLPVPQDPRSLGQVKSCAGEGDSRSQVRQIRVVQGEREFTGAGDDQIIHECL